MSDLKRSAKMKNLLRISTATSIFVFLYLLVSVRIIPAVGVDAILPSNLIRQTTYEERSEMSGNIRRLMTPSIFLISSAGFISLANSACLYLLSREQKKH
jgi:hypothetical protein